MPTSKTRTADLEASATGEAKPKRIRKPSTPKASPANGAEHEPQKTVKKSPRQRANIADREIVGESPAGSNAVPLVSFSLEDISVRAYFIAENRRSRGISGDSESDWLEAERQLKAEAAIV
jgi:hypothetical protein